MRKITKIILHCSASDKPEQGSEQAIRLLHTLPTWFKCDWGNYKDVVCKGWNDIGYHAVIEASGRSMSGRVVMDPGAHCKDHNHDSIGVCLTGDSSFTDAQFRTLVQVVYAYCKHYGLDPLKDVYPHSHFNKGKTCPNFDWLEVWKKHGGIIYVGN